MNPQELEQVLTQHRVWVKSLGREGTSADLRGRDLRGADLRGRDLRGADLRGANMEGADLRGANMEGVDLEGADLRWAVLHGANLTDANLHGANLRGADLRGANLKEANLTDANLHGANLHGINLRRADLHGANLQGSVGIPVVVDSGDRLRAVAVAATTNYDNLKMDTWHTCSTTHCIAGWAIHQAGETGRILEELHGPELAGRMLLGHEAATHFHDSNEDARAWLLSVLSS